MKLPDFTLLEFPKGFDHVQNVIAHHGIWEEKTTDYVCRHLKPGQIFMDVGAQVGYYSILAASLGAQVIAFEPSTTNRELLQRNLDKFGFTHQVTVLPWALSNANGVARLYKGVTPGQHSLERATPVTDDHEVVQTCTYDSLRLPIPDMLKIDIEGHEIPALQGMITILGTTRPITLIIESWNRQAPHWLAREQGFMPVLFEKLYDNWILVKNHESHETFVDG